MLMTFFRIDVGETHYIGGEYRMHLRPVLNVSRNLIHSVVKLNALIDMLIR